MIIFEGKPSLSQSDFDGSFSFDSRPTATEVLWDISNTVCRSLNLSGLDHNLKQIVWTNCIFTGCTFKYSDFLNSQFIGCKFDNCRFIACKVDTCRFERTGFSQSRFVETHFKDSRITDSQLIGVKFVSAMFSNTIFYRGSVDNVVFDECEECNGSMFVAMEEKGYVDYRMSSLSRGFVRKNADGIQALSEFQNL